MEGLFGRKLGMTQIFSEDGVLIPVTVIEIFPATVIAIREYASGKRSAQVAFGDAKEKNIKKPVLGIFKKLGLEPKRYIKEVVLDKDESLEIGQQIDASFFEEINKVDVIGRSKGRGFQGGVRRWGWSGGPATHGSMSHRVIGSVGPGTYPGRVIKGRHLPGHMGNERKTVQNLKVIKVDVENNVLIIKGSVPGALKSMVFVRKAKKAK